MNRRSVADLRKGERARIVALLDEQLSVKLFELGFLPNTWVELVFVAPLGDPIGVRINESYQLSLRKEEAKTILIAS
ncbi:MAG: iron transporter FeoA [Thermonema sp.]|jgi:ferrous iron transport protein A|uniref:FeoA family protein n=1 Tax=Thermonema TaxID=28194 RepID=UPI00056F1D18|nr:MULTISPECIES: FeoA family protein [Thermonema]GIV39180.1 MAG: iron transporter FeoA [Thermonema sp.]